MDSLIFFELNVQIFVYVLLILLEVFQVGELFKPVRVPIPLLTHQGDRTPAHQRPFSPLKDLVQRRKVPDGLPFLDFTDIYDIIFHKNE